MTAALALAAVLLFGIGAAHSVLGERYILIRLFRRENLPALFGGTEFTIRTLRFAWHLTTVAWWGMAALLVQLARGRASAGSVAAIIGLTFIGSGLLALVGSRGRHLSWAVFLVIGALALLAGPR